MVGKDYRVSHARDFGIWGSCNEFLAFPLAKDMG